MQDFKFICQVLVFFGLTPSLYCRQSNLVKIQIFHIPPLPKDLQWPTIASVRNHQTWPQSTKCCMIRPCLPHCPHLPLGCLLSFPTCRLLSEHRSYHTLSGLKTTQHPDILFTDLMSSHIWLLILHFYRAVIPNYAPLQNQRDILPIALSSSLFIKLITPVVNWLMTIFSSKFQDPWSQEPCLSPWLNFWHLVSFNAHTLTSYNWHHLGRESF